MVKPGGNPIALVDDLLKGNVVTGLIIGATAVVAWPVIGALTRPVAKAAIKGGILAYLEATKLCESTPRGISDLAKEAMDELGPELAKEVVTEVGTDLLEEAL